MYLLLFRIGKRKEYLIRQEKEIWLTGKKGIGLWGLCLAVLIGALSGFWQERNGVQNSFAAENDTFWVDMKDENDRLLLVKEGTIFPVSDRVRLEIPMERMPCRQVSLQIIAVDEEGEVFGSRIIRVRATE